MTRVRFQMTRTGHPQGNASGGRREDLGLFMRSSTEANVARLFRWMGIEWKYEPHEFEFPVNRGIRFYRPDFLITIPEGAGCGAVRSLWPRALDLPAGSYWVEVKGWMDETSRTKIGRFIDCYPDEAKRLLIITRNPGRGRYSWGPRLNAKIDKAGVRLVDVTPLMAIGAALRLEGWEGRKT
jgi:hypothetical protein